MNKIYVGISIMALLFIGNCKKAYAQLLAVGDDAPEMKVDQWVKGANVTLFQKGKVYLIDLWATWCVPCIASMPHLTELQSKYKANGLEVIGITSEDKYGNTLDNVKKFVQKRDSVMNYNIAWLPPSEDGTEKGIWLHPWMKKSGLGNLPTTFLVDRNGKIAYIGDPFTIDETLAMVMSDHYDFNTLKAKYQQGIESEKALSNFVQALKSNDENALKYAKHILSDFSYVKPNTYLVLSWQIAHRSGEITPGLLQCGYESITRGIKATKFASPAFFDVLAAIYAIKKDYFQAVIYEKLAVSMSDGNMKEQQLKTLQKYLTLASGN